MAELADEDLETALIALVRRVAPWAEVRFEGHAVRPPGVSWDGERLVTTGATYESAMHEIAHLLVAPPERLRLPELGLGPDPYRRSFVERTVPQPEADAEELAACQMQLLLVRLFGLSEARVFSEYGTAPLTPEVVASLEERYRDRLPEAWWARATASVE